MMESKVKIEESYVALCDEIAILQQATTPDQLGISRAGSSIKILHNLEASPYPPILQVA